MQHKPTLTVGEFYTRHSEPLELALVGPQIGFDRLIREPTINRPGLALTGFYDYFAEKRIQVLGGAELSYLKSLAPDEQRARLRELCKQPFPCFVIARSESFTVPEVLVEEAADAGIAIFSTPMVTMHWTNAATLALELDFARTGNAHGCMVDVGGVGVFLRGDSGVGKSEIVLGLLERGYSLISDDITCFRAHEQRYLLATAPDILRHHMEVRGLGFINVLATFGAAAVRQEKRLDMVVTLKRWDEIEDIERVGAEAEYFELLGIFIPHVTIPVREGRDMARLIEVAALDQKLKMMGHNSAQLFVERQLTATRAKKS